MLILGIESSCDDTGVSVVEDGFLIRSSVVSSQDFIHSRYGGVVPELASRRHIEVIIPIVEEALRGAGVILDDIDAIGVTQGPGLVGSILVGLSFAKAVSYVKGIPFVGVNHVVSHPLAVFLKEKGGDNRGVPDFPFVALVVSGGHTVLLLVEDYTRHRTLGQTRDDACGEAFDKVAKLLGLGYPGGAIIDRLAREGDPEYIEFTRPYISHGSLEFSFSGLKTAVLNYVRKQDRPLTEETVRNISASFQEACVDVLVKKCEWAIEGTGLGDLVVSGGVSCNSRLRRRLGEMAEKKGINLFIPPPHLCTDNGAMIALSAYHLLREGKRGDLTMNAIPTWEDL